MSDTVIHIPSSTHEAFKLSCHRQGLRMRDVADQLISDWLINAKIKKPQTRPPPKSNTIDPYTRPPFWAGRNMP